MFIITYRKLFYALSLILVVVSLFAFITPGMRFGIDFVGGTITEVSYVNRPEKTIIEENIKRLSIGDTIIQPIGTNGYVIRSKELSEQEKVQFMSALSVASNTMMSVERYNSIGPVVGNELRQKAYTAIAVVVVLIVLFVTFAFRKVSEPVASWKFGLATIIALAHDILIPTGAFIFISYFIGGDVDMLFVSAILAILGFSVHDTIVVFDRVREHLGLNKKNNINEPFDITVGKSVRETFSRSINTSITIFIVLMALFILGPETTRNFTLTLIIGIITGTYSSIFIASPLLVTFQKLQNKKII